MTINQKAVQLSRLIVQPKSDLLEAYRVFRADVVAQDKKPVVNLKKL